MPSIRSAHDDMPQRMSTPIERRGQTVTVTVAFTLTCAILCLGTRLYMRWPWRKLMGTNDILAVLATVFMIANAAAVSVAVSHKYGFDTLSTENAQTIRTAILTSELFYYISICLANMSVVEFIVALKGVMALWIVDYALRIVVPIWGLAGIIVTAVYLGTDFSVSSAPAIVLAVIGCIIQIATFTCAALITIPLQTSRSTKTRVLFGFSPSFLVIAAFIVSAVVTPANHFFLTDNSVADINYTITLQVVQLFLIIYATTPALLQIGKQFSTGFSGAVIDENRTMSGYGLGSSGRTRRTGAASGKQESYEFKTIGVGGQQVVSTISASQARRDRSAGENHRRDRSMKQPRGGEGDGLSIASDSSQKIIIQKSVTQSSVNI